MVIRNILEKIGYTSTILSYGAAITLFMMMLLTTVDVAARYIFKYPILGVYELTEFMMVTVVFLSIGYTQSIKGHVEVDILVTRFPKRLQKIIDRINHSLSFIVLFLITWWSVDRGFEVSGTGEQSGDLGIPVFPFYFVVALGSAAMCIELLKDILRKEE